ncbi:MAG TPA: tetratricopeptide repeat protein [Bryobacteraceae bacterium]|nr:tetratricopeptide repeat protein [Bryobacteraceae bacterium]
MNGSQIGNLTSSSWRTYSVPSKTLITGSVKVDDGSALPGSAAIVLICGGSVRTVAHTSILDDFSFETVALSGYSSPGVANAWSLLSSANADASSAMHSLSGNNNCDLRAELSGFRSTTINLNNPAAFNGSDIGVIWLHRIAAPGDHIVSITTLAAPKAAKKNFDKARAQALAGKLKDAVSSFRKAVKIDPQFAEAWVGLGFAQYQLGLQDEAEKSVLKARDIDAKLPGIYQILGYLASGRKDWKTAALYLEEAERLNPESSALPWYISAVAYYQLHRFNEAEKSIRQEMQIDTERRYRRAQFLLGMILVARNEIVTGTQALREYLAGSPDPADVKPANAMLSRLALLAAK